MSPIEAMARAIWFASALNITGHRNLSGEWAAMGESDREPYFDKARAALTALAENVSDGMARAAVTVEFEKPDSELRRDLIDRKKRDFRAMCAAAGGE